MSVIKAAHCTRSTSHKYSDANAVDVGLVELWTPVELLLLLADFFLSLYSKTRRRHCVLNGLDTIRRSPGTPAAVQPFDTCNRLKLAGLLLKGNNVRTAPASR